METTELFGHPQKLVMDPVHGGIPLFAHELDAIDQPLFQRLRHICQNDILFMVFPGARHSRFEHSIGTMHVAGRFYKAVIRAYLGEGSTNGKAIPQAVVDAINYFYHVVRLAALLHDVGHAPFSHQFEQPKKTKELLNFDLLWPEDKWKAYYQQKPVEIHHEHFSVRYALEILTGVRHSPVETQDVLVILETATGPPSPTFERHVGQLASFFVPYLPANDSLSSIALSFLRKMITSELDVDKMDYLLRDSYYSGSHYGSYNLDHLLTTVRFGFDPSDNWTGIGITEKGIHPLEDFVHSRFQMYVSVYYHKTVSGLRWLLEEAINEILKDPAVAGWISTALYNPHEFVYLTDSYFWEAFRAYARSHPGSASDRLFSRQKLKYLFAKTNISQFEIKSLVAPLLEQDVVVRNSKAKFSNLHESVDEIRVIVRDRASGRRSLKSVRSVSSFFGKFENTRITQVFEKPDLEAVPLR